MKKIDIEWNGWHWIAILPGSVLADQDVDRLKSRIRNHGCYPGEMRYQIHTELRLRVYHSLGTEMW